MGFSKWTSLGKFNACETPVAGCSADGRLEVFIPYQESGGTLPTWGLHSVSESTRGGGLSQHDDILTSQPLAPGDGTPLVGPVVLGPDSKLWVFLRVGGALCYLEQLWSAPCAERSLSLKGGQAWSDICSLESFQSDSEPAVVLAPTGAAKIVATAEAGGLYTKPLAAAGGSGGISSWGPWAGPGEGGTDATGHPFGTEWSPQGKYRVLALGRHPHFSKNTPFVYIDGVDHVEGKNAAGVVCTSGGDPWVFGGRLLAADGAFLTTMTADIVGVFPRNYPEFDLFYKDGSRILSVRVKPDFTHLGGRCQPGRISAPVELGEAMGDVVVAMNAAGAYEVFASHISNPTMPFGYRSQSYPSGKWETDWQKLDDFAPDGFSLAYTWDRKLALSARRGNRIKYCVQIAP